MIWAREGVEGGEFLFFAEFAEEGEFEFLIVEVFGEVEKVGFDGEARGWSQRWGGRQC